jgi:CIC family chloride channel protein
MGVLFAAFLRAPLTSVFMVLEVSGNYSIILPVILANMIAYLISRGLQPVPIFEVFTHQDGLDLPSMEEEREESELHLEDALRPVDIPIVKGNESIAEAAQAISTTQYPAFLVHLWDGTWYAMTKDELTAVSATLTQETPIERALPAERTPILFPDLPLDSALPYFPRWPLLPIMNRASRGTLEGIVALEDVLRRYQRR